MPSFDIVSKVQWNEVDNALNQSQKEIGQRYDFKDTETELEKNDGVVPGVPTRFENPVTFANVSVST